MWSSVKTLLEEPHSLICIFQILEDRNITGIYMIKNVVNGKMYIGQSKDIKFRWTHHKCDLRCNCHSNKHLQGAWNKYGEDSFEFSVIEETDPDNLNSRERYWITKYNSVNNCYNFDYGGDGCFGYKHSENEINKMRRIQSPNIILQFDKDCKFIKEWIGGASHIYKELKYTKECVLLRCNHKIKEMSLYKDSYWVYKEEYEHHDFTWNKYFANEKIVDIKKKSNKTVKRICQYTKDRELIKIWDSLKDIREAGYNTSPISTILHFSRGKRTSQGFIWTFEDYDFSDGYFDGLIKYKNKANDNRKIRVIQVDCNTLEHVAEYESITKAAEALGHNCSGAISIATKNPFIKTSCGFYWIKAS